MELTIDEQAMLRGEGGEAQRWAMDFQVAVGEFFNASRMVPITCAHMMGDMEVGGDG